MNDKIFKSPMKTLKQVFKDGENFVLLLMQINSLNQYKQNNNPKIFLSVMKCMSCKISLGYQILNIITTLP